MGTRIILTLVMIDVVMTIFYGGSNFLSGIMSSLGFVLTDVGGNQVIIWKLSSMNFLFAFITVAGSVLVASTVILGNRDSSFATAIPYMVLYIGLVAFPMSTFQAMQIPYQVQILLGVIFTVMYVIAIGNFVRGGEF